MEEKVKIITDNDGKEIVLINSIRFKGKRAINWDDVRLYLNDYVGEMYTIACTEDVVYLGKDLPDEYTGSEDTYSLKGTLAKAKANAIKGYEIELANDIELRFDQSGNFIGTDD